MGTWRRQGIGTTFPSIKVSLTIHYNEREANMNYDIRDLSFADRGRQRIAWAARHMPVLARLQSEFAAERPFEGRRIAASLHITTETAVLLHVLRTGGAELAQIGRASCRERG